jgi:hypothetical protein
MNILNWPWWRIAQAVFGMLLLLELHSILQVATDLDARLSVSKSAGILTPGGYSVVTGPDDMAGFTLNTWLERIEANTRPAGKPAPSTWDTVRPAR